MHNEHNSLNDCFVSLVLWLSLCCVHLYVFRTPLVCCCRRIHFPFMVECYLEFVNICFTLNCFPAQTGCGYDLLDVRKETTSINI